MPKVYTVQTDNPYSALYDDSDNEEAILTSMPVQPEEPQTAAPVREQKPRKDQAVPSSRPRDRRPPRRQASEEPISPVEQAKQPRPPRRREREGGPSEGRLDRQSGTGRGKEVRKDGAGAHSWGNPVEDWQEGRVEPEASPTVAEPTEGAETNPPREERPAVQTYADYEKANQTDEPALAAKQTVKSQRNVDAGFEVYTKSHTNEVARVKENKETKKEKPLHIAELAAKNGMSIRYPNNDRRREPRERREPRTPNKNVDREINLGDQAAFPTLG